ncbi:MAG: methyltransferase [Pedosphaera sp.]|nr:methyltransferase [Pedosphaera sp.]
MKTKTMGAPVEALRPARTCPLLLFARNFFKHPRMLGSPIPSSQQLIEGVLQPVNWVEARVIIEYGPGVGSLTVEILRRMHPRAILLAIETNGDFVEYLGEALSDPRLRLVHGSAAKTDALLARHGCGRADYIISGIPFSTMPMGGRETILNVTHAALRPQGAFLVYQYSQRIFPSLKKIFGDVRRNFLLAKLIPMWLFQCSR